MSTICRKYFHFYFLIIWFLYMYQVSDNYKLLLISHFLSHYSVLCPNMNHIIIIFVYVQKADKRTLDLNKVNNSLFDTKTIDTSKKIKEILDRMAVNVSFYNSRYFDMYCKLLQHQINWQDILVTATIDKNQLKWQEM